MDKKKIIVISIIFITILVTVITLTEEKRTNVETNIRGKEMTKEDYIYKDRLLELGYTIDEVKTIEKKVSIGNVKNYLLDKKYDNLITFISSPYFKAEYISRYENYYLLHNDYSFDEITIYVNIGIDQEQYTNIKEIVDYKSITTLINKYNNLNKDAEFDDLINIETAYATDNQKIRSVAYTPLVNMINDAKKNNINLKVISSYRTYDKQEFLFNNSVNKNGINHALLYSAKPGHSEHQLGLAVDLNTTDNNFENTKEYEWLKNNSYKYGFILRYPKGKEYLTGFAFEPWHYRYVGIDIATKIFEEDITFEEYVVKYLK